MTAFLKKHSVAAAWVLAACAAAAFPFVAAVMDSAAPLTNSVLLLLCGAAAFFLIRRALDVLTDRLFWFAFAGGFLLSLFLAVGRDICLVRHVDLTVRGLLRLLLVSAAFTPLPAAGLCVLFDALPRAGRRANANADAAIGPARLPGAGLFLLVWVVLLVCWLPAYLGFFPGIYGYDMHNQHHQVMSGLYNTFQPLIHTLFYQLCYRLGAAVTGSATGGVAVYTAVQALALSACLAGVVTYLEKRLRAPAAVTYLSAAFYALLPYHAVLAVSSTKDAVFGGLFLVLLLQVYDVCIDPKAFFRAPLRIAGFVLSVVLTCLFRNNMLYALCFLAPFLVLGVKEKRVLVLGLAIVSLLIAVLGKTALKRACGASDGPRIEMLSVPIQQVAMVYSRHADELTAAQKAQITEYLPEAALNDFDPLLADHVKDHCNIGDGAPSIRGFLSVWASLLPQYLNDYADEFLLITCGYWYPDETLHDDIYAGYHEADTEESLGYQYTGFMESIDPDVKKQSLWPAAERYYNFFAHENGHERIPLVSLLFSPGFACWALLIAMLALLYFRQYRLLLPLMLPLGTWLTLLLGPCLVIRYAYPLMASLPLLVGVCLNRRDDTRLCAPEPQAAGNGRGAEMLRFAIAGGLGFLIDYGLMVALTELVGMHYLVATAIGFTVSVIANYLLCAYWVFRGANTGNKGVKAGFLLTSVIGLGLNELIMFLLVDAAHWNYMLAKLLAVVLVMVWNYITKRKILVKKEKKTEDVNP